jgi:hypothetical protein
MGKLLTSIEKELKKKEELYNLFSLYEKIKQVNLI